jgi:hypothetical protein
MKRCPRCEQKRPAQEFYTAKTVSGLSTYCKVCTRERQREYNQRKAEEISESRKGARRTAEGQRKGRDRDLRRHYGISLATLERMIRAQGGQCAICEDIFKSDRHTHVDHCHFTGAIRGILCSSCNLMLGHAKDDPKRLLAAAQYLEQPS